MRKIVGVACAIIALGISAMADYGFRPNGEQSLTDLSKWGSAPSLTENTGYRIGSASGATGLVSSVDGTFSILGASANILHVGDQGTGAIRMTGGTMNVTGAMRVAAAGSATGVLNLSGGTLNVGTDLAVARFNTGAVGTINISGGTLSVANNILIGSGTTSGESAIINYTGGSISADGQFQMQDGTLNFQLGLDPISCNQRTGSSTADLALIDVIFGGGYSHVAGTTNLFITSDSQAGVFTLSTDSGNVALDTGTHGDSVTVDGYDFEIYSTSGTGGALGIVAIPEPATLGLFGMSALAVYFLRRKSFLG